MQKIILKIKGIKCRIIQDWQKEIHCRHYHRCGGCCGLKTCECNHKLIIKKNES